MRKFSMLITDGATFSNVFFQLTARLARQRKRSLNSSAIFVVSDEVLCTTVSCFIENLTQFMT